MSMSLLPDYFFTELRVHDLIDVMRIERAASDSPWRAAHFADSLRNDCEGVCIRQADGVLCGYCLWMRAVDEIHLLNLCVAPDRQKKGLGLVLLHRATQAACAMGGISMLLEVNASNRRALHLYQRFGFVEIGVRKSYYKAASGACEDARVMRLRLSGLQYAAA